jgi:hypothetical protein
MNVQGAVYPMGSVRAFVLVPLAAPQAATPKVAALARGLGLASVRCLTSAGLPVEAYLSANGPETPTRGSGTLLINGNFDMSPDDAAAINRLSFVVEGPGSRRSEQIDVVAGGRLDGFGPLCAELGRLMEAQFDCSQPPAYARSSLSLVIESLFLALRLALATRSSPASDVLATAGSLAAAIARSATPFAGERSADAVLDIGQWLGGQGRDDWAAASLDALKVERNRLADLAQRFARLSSERERAWRARHAALSGDDASATRLLQSLKASRPVEAGFDLACLMFRLGDFKASSDAARLALSSLRDERAGFVDLAFSIDNQPPESSRSWRDVLACQLALSLLRGGDYDAALQAARGAAASSPRPEHALRLEAHVLRDWAMDEHGRGKGAWRAHLAMHLEALDRVYAVDPQREEVVAALEASEFLEDEDARNRWLSRLANPHP